MRKPDYRTPRYERNALAPPMRTAGESSPAVGVQFDFFEPGTQTFDVGTTQTLTSVSISG